MSSDYVVKQEKRDPKKIKIIETEKNEQRQKKKDADQIKQIEKEKQKSDQSQEEK